jgi:N-acetylglucosaminyl-diphospho-decaprenol L-rhamnosyltransferase
VSLSVDIVVPTYGGWEFTERCLEHLQQQTMAHIVIVADNGSHDGTPDRVRKAFPEVRLIELGANYGFAIACNRGVATGESDVVVLVNSDVECTPDFLERIVAPFEDERVGLVAAMLVKPEVQTIDGVGIVADRSTVDASLASPALTGPSGGAGAYRRVAWEAVGGLDERIFMYSDDLDLALRMRSAGWDAAVAADAVAIHLGSATAGHRTAWQRYQAGRSRGYLLRRYGVLRRRTIARALATEAIVVVGDALISGDLSALRGRLSGWNEARGLPRVPMPPPDSLDPSIGFLESLRLRRTAYAA